MVTMFIYKLQSSFYDRMIEKVSSKFSNLVIIVKSVEIEVRSRKFVHMAILMSIMSPPIFMDKKKEGEKNSPRINANNTQKKRNNQQRTLAPILMTYTDLLSHLIYNSLIVSFPPKPIQPPYLKTFYPNAKCNYHAGAIGNSIKKWWGLRHKVQDLIDMRWSKCHVSVSEAYPLSLGGREGLNPMRFILSKLYKFKMIEEQALKAKMCNLHPKAKHSIKECNEFK
ncbi:hypothetical protein CR513_40606, partial [Mucuna pruriens]